LNDYIRLNYQSSYFMYRSFILSFSLLLIFGCSNDQNKLNNKKNDKEKLHQLMEQKLKLNKKNYSIRIGEKVKIYYSTNSCCPFCAPRLNQLTSIRYIGHKMEINPCEKCEGNNVLSSINFVGLKKGIDTVFAQTISPHDTCDSIKDLKDFDIHIIRVN